MSQSGSSEPSPKHHARVRRQHLDELAEDYVEAIYSLNRRGTPVTGKDLQLHFGVTHVAVVRALNRLEDRKLLCRNRTKGIQLTNPGLKMAKESLKRHTLLVKFLKSLGVSKEQAEADAEGAEHHLSKETFQMIQHHLDSKKNEPHRQHPPEDIQ